MFFHEVPRLQAMSGIAIPSGVIFVSLNHFFRNLTTLINNNITRNPKICLFRLTLSLKKLGGHSDNALSKAAFYIHSFNVEKLSHVRAFIHYGFLFILDKH